MLSGSLRFDGDVALVTGGTAGIGAAWCRLLAGRGAKVLINAYRNSDAGVRLVEELRAAGGHAEYCVANVADDCEARALVDAAIRAFGQLDIVINNAGDANLSRPIEAAPDEILRAQLDVHLRGTLQVVRAAWPHLVHRGKGRILNTGSAVTYGYGGAWGWDGAYTIAKAPLFAVTRQMSGAGKPHHLRANLIAPMAYTTMAKAALEGTADGHWWAKHLDPERVVAAALYLVHSDCPVSGQFFSCAGGRIARVVLATTPGLFSPDLTPEDVRDRWTEAMGDFGDALVLDGQADELEILQRILT